MFRNAGCFTVLASFLFLVVEPAADYDTCYPLGRCANLWTDSTCNGLLNGKSASDMLTQCTKPEFHAYCCKSCLMKLSAAQNPVGTNRFCSKPNPTWVNVMKSCNNQNSPNQKWCDMAAKAGYCQQTNTCTQFRLIMSHGCLTSCANSVPNGNAAYCP